MLWIDKLICRFGCGLLLIHFSKIWVRWTMGFYSTGIQCSKHIKKIAFLRTKLFGKRMRIELVNSTTSSIFKAKVKGYEPRWIRYVEGVTSTRSGSNKCASWSYRVGEERKFKGRVARSKYDSRYIQGEWSTRRVSQRSRKRQVRLIAMQAAGQGRDSQKEKNNPN